MKSIFYLLVFVVSLLTTTLKSQIFNDSLKGFDKNQVVLYAKQNGVEGQELYNYIKQRQRNFIKEKYFKLGRPFYYLPQDFSPTENPTHEPPISGKLLGGPGNVLVAPCVNEGFENTAAGSYNGAANAFAVQGWTLYGNYATNAGYNCNSLGSPYNLGANEFSIVTTPINYAATLGGCSFVIGNSPFGGVRVARMGDNTSNYARNKIAQRFPVTQANALFQFAFAGI